MIASPDQCRHGHAMTARNTGHRAGGTYCKACNRISAHGADRVVCLEGHPLTPDNVVLTPKGFRKCRACRERVPTVDVRWGDMSGLRYQLRGEITIEIAFGGQSLGRFVVKVPREQLEAVG